LLRKIFYGVPVEESAPGTTNSKVPLNDTNGGSINGELSSVAADPSLSSSSSPAQPAGDASQMFKFIK
jgi:hypothetical protein